MTAVQMIQNRPTMSAGVMAAKVKGHPKYDYAVKRLDNDACEIEFLQGDRSLGVSSFTIDDARQAGWAAKANYKQMPRNMLFARALSNGVRWYTPDVFNASVYTPEDFMGESEDPPPEVRVEVVSRPEKPVEAAVVAELTRVPETVTGADGVTTDAPTMASQDQRTAVNRELKKQRMTKEDAVGFFRWLTGRDNITGSADLEAREATTFLALAAQGGLENALADYAVEASGGPPDVSDLKDHA
jgi:hypothetical protein